MGVCYSKKALIIENSTNNEKKIGYDFTNLLKKRQLLGIDFDWRPFLGSLETVFTK